jgi:hypothetical protein
MATKKLFLVDTGYGAEHSELVVAETAHQARVLGMHMTDLEPDSYGDENEYKAREVACYYLSDEKIPQKKIDSFDWGTVSDGKTNEGFRREVGFAVDGDNRCASCGLADMDGEFPICDECGQCEECGHDEDCEEGRLEEAEA